MLLAAGLLFATLISLLSIAEVNLTDGRPQLASRTHDVWLSASTLLVTQDGFPWGRAILDETVRVRAAADAEPTYIPRFSDSNRYASLAVLYAELAKSDAVRRVVMKGSGKGVSYEPLVANDGGGPLPVIYMKGFGPTPEAAEAIANRASDAFRAYLTAEQEQNKIAPDKRIELAVVSRATPAEVFEGRSLVRPMFLFLAVLMVFVAAAFVLENLRPRERRPTSEVHRVARAPEAKSATAQRAR